MATIFDVLDNFFASQQQDDRDVTTLSGRKILELAEAVQRYAASVDAPKIQQDSSPVYVGGWPSANIWNVQIGGAAFASLLYSGQLLAKDPICDWFSKEQYAHPRQFSARQGYISGVSQKLEWNIQQSRTFLKNTLPGLRRIRSLVESGVVVLIPSALSRAKSWETVDKLGNELAGTLCADALKFSSQFAPRELPTDDNMRGVFIFAGGDRENQIRKSVAGSIKYLLSEYFLAREFGFDFVAPFKFEQFLCKEGISKKVESSYQSSVVEGLLGSSFPLFQGLTPETLLSIRDDKAFGVFRKELLSIYSQLPNEKTPEDVRRFLSEVERAHLEPIIGQLEKEADRGFLYKAGVKLLPNVFRIGGAVLAAKMGADPANILNLLGGATAGEAVNQLVDRVFSREKDSGTRALSVWKKLYVNGASADSEIESKRSTKVFCGSA